MSKSTPPERKASPAAIMALLGNSELPLLTSKMVAREFDCSKETARNRLGELVTDGELERFDLGGRQAIWLDPDYETGAELARQLREEINLSSINTDQLAAFAEQPYKVLPAGENEYWVITPRFVPFACGFLHHQDDAWQTFKINEYVKWIPDLPEPIRERINLTQRYEEALVEDGILRLADNDERERAWNDFNGDEGPLEERVDENKIKIETGKEIEVVAQLIETGNLPFSSSPVDADDLRPEPDSIHLREYQQRAWDRFEDTGQIGIFWPPGLGKSYFSLYAGDRIDGDKLVIVRGGTLADQWRERIREFASNPDQWEVRTYQYLITKEHIHDYQGEDGPTLTIFDECHVLPADKYSGLATINTEYRIGCSASPYREDGRSSYIFALTGHPLGVEWEELMKYHSEVEYPDVAVYMYDDAEAKRKDVGRLIEQEPGKTLVFCDWLEEGRQLAQELDAPFVRGSTSEDQRLRILQDNDVIVASSVADEGISISGLDRVIEHKFLGSSRRQEVQRSGRLMHSKGRGQHIIQMTDQEYQDYGGRLQAHEDNGVDLRFERRSN